MPPLRRISIAEISLVDKAANRRKLALYKSENGGHRMPKVFSEAGKALVTDRINKADPNEEAVLAKVAELRKAAGLPPDEEAAMAILRVAGGADTPVEKRAELVHALMGGTVKEPEVIVKATCTECGATVAKGETLCKACADKQKVAKSQEGAMPDHLTKLAETQPALAHLLKAADPTVAAVMVEVIKSNEALAAQVADLKKSEDDKVAVQKAAEIAAPIGGKPDANVVKLLKAAPTPEFAEALASLLKSQNQQIAAGALFAELGKGTVSEDSATGQIEALAKAEVAKSSEKLTQEQATARVAETHPELWARYLAEGR
jgi:hypothetical protein